MAALLHGNAHDAVARAVFTSFKADGDKLRVDLPAKAIVTLEIQ